MNKVQALDKFWNSFGLLAYDENSVPEDAKLPYITYDVITSDFGNVLTLNASIWDRSYSWKTLQEKEEEIANYIGRGGLMVSYDGGAFWLRKSSNWAQRMRDADNAIRRIVLSIEIEFID